MKNLSKTFGEKSDEILLIGAAAGDTSLVEKMLTANTSSQARREAMLLAVFYGHNDTAMPLVHDYVKCLSASHDGPN